MRRITAEKIADQVSEWGHRGLIGPDLTQLLKQRYAVDATLGGVLLRWLGVIAVALLGASFLGFLSLSVGELALYLALVVLAVLAWVMGRKGVEMATEPRQRFATSGHVLVTASLLAAYAVLVLAYSLMGGSDFASAGPWMLAVVSAGAVLTAYRHGLRWPLVLGLLMAFHALGAMHRYGGHGVYLLGIHDERLMAAVAVAVAAVGVWHERDWEERAASRHLGFGSIYLVLGLLYANVSFWLLTVPGGDLVPVLAFTAAGVAQLVLGAWLHDGRFTGFGIVFLAIDLYTRFFEHFWDDLSKGLFFLLAGLVAMAVGAALELRARTLRRGGEA